MQLHQHDRSGPEWHLDCQTIAACWRDLLSLNFLIMDPFPLPIKWDVMSHPKNACKNGMCLHTKEPSFALTSLMFYIRPFVFFLRSEAKKISLPCWGKWCNRRTSKSVSSPIKTVSIEDADSIVFWTMRRSASAWHTWPKDIRYSLSSDIRIKMVVIFILSFFYSEWSNNHLIFILSFHFLWVILFEKNRITSNNHFFSKWENVIIFFQQ